MAQLAIVHEALVVELRMLIQYSDKSEDINILSYLGHLTKILTISLVNAKDALADRRLRIWVGDNYTLVNQKKYDRELRKFKKTVKRLQHMRNTLSAHVDEEAVAKVIERYPETCGKVAISMDAREFCFSVASELSLLSCMMGVETTEPLSDHLIIKRYGQFLRSLREAHLAAIFLIRTIVHGHFRNVGVWS